MAATPTDRTAREVRPRSATEDAVPAPPAGRAGGAPTGAPQTPGRGSRGPTRLAWLPIPLLLAAICLLWATDTDTAYESLPVLFGINLLFALPAALSIAYLVGGGFLARGQPGLLLLGCGVLIWGAAASLGALAGRVRGGFAPFDFDAGLTVNNLCLWLAAVCHLAGVVLGRRLDRPLRARCLWLALGYCLALAAAGLIVPAALAGWFPVFFVEGLGGTPVRDFVLGSAISLYTLTALLLAEENRAHRSAFVDWYVLALLLLAVGLVGALVQSVPGSLGSWAGRLARLLAGVYMLVAAVAAVRESDPGGRSTGESLGDALGPSPGAGRATVRHPYFAAVVLVVAATALRLAFLADLGMRESYLVFFPAVALAALYGGLWPGLLAAALAAVLADRFWIGSAGALALYDPADALGMAVFLLSCALIAWTAEAMHRARARAVAARARAAAAEAKAGFAAERARAARAVRESRDRLALGIQVAGIALADIDYPSETARLSPEAARLLGLGERARRVPLARLPALCHPEDRDEVLRRIAASLDLAGRGALAFDCRIVRPDGQVRWIGVRQRTVFDRSGALARPLTATLAAHDITERRQAQEALADQAERLREADRRKDEFLAMLGHELRNPLTPILTAAQILELRGAHDPALVQWAGATVKRQGQHLTRLVNDLLDAARVTQGKIALEKSPVELGALLERVLEAGRPFMDERRHRLAFDPAGEPLTVDGDATRLEQALGNVLHNAAKYTPDGGQIRVGLRREGRLAVVRVQDNGIGIAAATLPGIFGLFAQAERTPDRAQGGLGIGLALVKTLVEMHGGSVAAFSPGVGLGTEVAVRLPLRAPVPVAPPDPAARPPTVARARQILAVDDNPDVRESLELLVAALGHRVRTAATGEEGLALIASAVPDLALVDIGMPGIDGYEVARRIRRNPAWRGLRLVAMSGYGQPEDLQRSAQAGFDRHLVKPVDLQTLVEALAEGQDPVGEP